MGQFNFPNQGPNSGSNNVASDKLRKAIERNRMRQAKRENRSSKLSGMNASSSRTTTTTNSGSQQEFFFNSRTTPKSTIPRSTATQRVSVATPNQETQFVRPATPTRVSTRKSTVKYPVKKTSTTKRKKVKAAKARNEWLMKAAWMVLILISLRLVFAERGMMDYFSMKDLINHKLSLIEQTKQDNQDIVKEIELLRNNSRYQKKMVREKLGFITSDEYLVIFSGESARKSK